VVLRVLALSLPHPDTNYAFVKAVGCYVAFRACMCVLCVGDCFFSGSVTGWRLLAWHLLKPFKTRAHHPAFGKMTQFICTNKSLEEQESDVFVRGLGLAAELTVSNTLGAVVDVDSSVLTVVPMDGACRALVDRDAGALAFLPARSRGVICRVCRVVVRNVGSLLSMSRHVLCLVRA